MNMFQSFSIIIKYIPLQQGLRLLGIKRDELPLFIIKYIPLQQGLRRFAITIIRWIAILLSIFHYNKD